MCSPVVQLLERCESTRREGQGLEAKALAYLTLGNLGKKKFF